MSRGEYRSIAKGTSVFGGVQVFNILISLIRGKFIAVLLGSSGMGISALLTSTASTMSQITQLGLNLSAVRDISQATEKNDGAELSRTVRIFGLLVTLTGGVGALATLILAPRLSRWAFGGGDYTAAFAALSVMVFFTALSDGRTAILQGTRRIAYLAKSTIVGSLAGLVTGVPLYWLFGTDGIAPAMIVLAMTTFFTKRYFTGKMQLVKPRVTIREIFDKGRGMVALGVAMMATTLLGALTIYLINIYINHSGGINDTGFFQAASSITNQYAGLVISAMAIDYFPRLAAVADNDRNVGIRVNRQSEIVALVIAPLVMALIIIAPLVIRILLTREFLAITPMLRWMGAGIFFKAVSFPLGYISFAKGDRTTFFLLEGVFCQMLVLGMNVAGYRLMGLVGLGVAFFAAHVIYFGVVYAVAYRRYKVRLGRSYLRMLFVLALFVLAVFGLSFSGNAILIYLPGTLLLLLCCLYSWRELDRRIGIKEVIKSKLSQR